MNQALLDVDSVSIVFGGLAAVSNFYCQLYEGELVGLIGPNGAGKTTVFNILSGLYRPTSGKVLYRSPDGSTVELAGREPYWIAKNGIARTFQNIRLFKELTVLDNVRISMHNRVAYSPFAALMRTNLFYKEEAQIEKAALELLELFGIRDKAAEQAQNLPYGAQRKLEIVRALAGKPRLLLLDEPAAGMNPQETVKLMEQISFIRDRFKLTILLIEHDMNLVMGICERLIVLDYGKIIAEGIPTEIKRNPAVIKAYLGEEALSNAES